MLLKCPTRNAGFDSQIFHICIELIFPKQDFIFWTCHTIKNIYIFFFAKRQLKVDGLPKSLYICRIKYQAFIAQPCHSKIH